jgi:hypothetical protein
MSLLRQNEKIREGFERKEKARATKEAGWGRRFITLVGMENNFRLITIAASHRPRHLRPSRPP